MPQYREGWRVIPAQRIKVKNFKGARSFRSDIKPSFVFYSAPLGKVVNIEVVYKAGNGRSLKRGFYIDVTEKEVTADGAVIWMPFSSPHSSVLLAEAARFSLPVLMKFAEKFDSGLPELAEEWLADKKLAEELICNRAFGAVMA
jgi:hypothetical protein